MSCAWTVFDTWMNDRDPEFAEKAVAIIELLLNPPANGALYCVDEKNGHRCANAHRSRPARGAWPASTTRVRVRPPEALSIYWLASVSTTARCAA